MESILSKRNIKDSVIIERVYLHMPKLGLLVASSFLKRVCWHVYAVDSLLVVHSSPTHHGILALAKWPSSPGLG